MTPPPETTRGSHTPGPWRGDRNDGTIKYVARGAGERAVLVINNKTGDYGFTCPQDEDCAEDCYSRHEADERLFLAAPAMLDALMNMSGAFDTPVERRRRPFDSFQEEAVQSMRAAIAAAQVREEERG